MGSPDERLVIVYERVSDGEAGLGAAGRPA